MGTVAVDDLKAFFKLANEPLRADRPGCELIDVPGVIKELELPLLSLKGVGREGVGMPTEYEADGWGREGRGGVCEDTPYRGIGESWDG
jgi:hypothetical protein